MIGLARWITPLSLLALGACSTPFGEVSPMSGEDPTSTGTAPTSTTTAPTPGEPTAGTPGQTGTNTAGPTSGVDSTATSGDGSDSGGSSSSTGSAGCQDDDECTNIQSCNLATGECESLCPGDAWGDGNYDYCLNEWGAFDTDNICAGQLDLTCVFAGDPIVGAVCANQNCTDICDCPQPPASGTAAVTCGNITMGDTDPECFLSCENGETCPDGMFCRNDLYCTHEPPPLSMYGNCDNVNAGPANGGCAEGQCLYFALGSYALCMEPCNNVGRCSSAPPGSSNNAGCANVAGPTADEECYIPCTNDRECPFSMTCVNNLVCMWFT